MVLKGTIQPDHMPLNKFQLVILGMPLITFTEISGIEVEIDSATMPDRTVVSGGSTKASEFTAKFPQHHFIERLAMEAWRRESEAGLLTYKRTATLVQLSLSGAQVSAKSILGLWPKKLKYPDLEMENEGEGAMIEVTFSADQVFPG